MELKRKNLCPLLQAECLGLDCMWFTKLYGTDPQDRDKLIEQWECAIVWQVKGLLETAKRTGQGLDALQRATETFRNDMVQLNEASLALSPDPLGARIVQARQARRVDAIGKLDGEQS
jgi:hypothetical protein